MAAGVQNTGRSHRWPVRAHRQVAARLRDSRHMGMISYHRAGVAKRQARAAMRASRRLRAEVDGVRDRNEELVEVVERQAVMIEELERQLDELRSRLEDR